MRLGNIPIWKKAPFLRLLLPVIAGILLQWYNQFDLQQILLAGVCFVTAIFAFRLLPIILRFKLQPLQGVLINLILIVFGLFITYQKDIRHQKNWYGNIHHDSDYIIATINEPLLEKNKSYKAEAIVNNVLHADTIENTTGKIIIYFEKDSSANQSLNYGDKILINKKLQPIKNSGNPGAFNYRRYLAFQQIFHNVFLKGNEWLLLKEKNAGIFNTYKFNTRKRIVNTLQKYILGEKEKAIAEALLIGYKTDLDKDLVQAYSNTGVVHIIAISGLHLGLIYALLLWLFNNIPVVKKSKITKLVLLLICLWLFAFLTGASPSVLRSAVMFSCIILGEGMKRKSYVFNSLAASAFLLLCYNPYLLWEVGFQLSYFAIIGIITFQKPIYKKIYIKNKLLNKVWQLMTVAIAAQIFTFPACLYYFHQFPVLFFITNLIVVPLATIILYAEIVLIISSFSVFIASYIGKVVSAFVWLMNATVLFINRLPFSLWDGVAASVTSTLLLYCLVICICFWLLNKNKFAFRLSMFTLFAFTALTAYTKWQTFQQQKLIVYNVPQHEAIDFINANEYKFIGDSILLADGMLQNFHLKPGRIALQLNKRVNHIPSLYESNNFYEFNNKKILLVQRSVTFAPLQQKINVDYIIISKNPKLYISQLVNVFNCGQIIFDASNSLWKIEKWKKDCEQLHLRCFSVPEEGAFVMDL